MELQKIIHCPIIAGFNPLPHCVNNFLQVYSTINLSRGLNSNSPCFKASFFVSFPFLQFHIAVVSLCFVATLRSKGEVECFLGKPHCSAKDYLELNTMANNFISRNVQVGYIYNTQDRRGSIV
ncbi:hypothetical protein ACS0TY_009195 [Phlomoides rotata]